MTLAFSAVEDLIAKYSEDGDNEDVFESPNARLASSRLDTELHRLHAQDKEIIYDDDYSKMPDAVKRSILNWYLEDPNEAGEDTFAHDMLSSDRKTTDGHVDIMNDVTDKLNNSQLSSTSTRIKTVSGMADTAGYLAKPSDFALPASKDTSLPVSLPQENSLLRETGLQHGYTENEIDSVLASSLGPMRTSDFLKALVANKKINNRICNPSSGVCLSEKTKITESQTVAFGTIMSNSPAKHPMDEFLSSGSPNLKSKQPQCQPPKVTRDKSDQQSFVDYFAKLSQDFQEEEGEIPIDELKRRSKERQKLLLDAFMKQKSDSQIDDNVVTITAEEELEEKEGIRDNERAENTNGRMKAGAKSKYHRRNKKRKDCQRPLYDSIPQDSNKNVPDQNFSSSSTKNQALFDSPNQSNSPKKQNANQNQNNKTTNNRHRFLSGSPLGKQPGRGPRSNSHNRSPSPYNQWQNRQSPKQIDMLQNQGLDGAASIRHHTSLQQQFISSEQQQRIPFCGYQQPPNQQPKNMFGSSHPQRQVFDLHQQQQISRQLPQQTDERYGMRGKRNLRYIIIDGSNVAMA